MLTGVVHVKRRIQDVDSKQDIANQYEVRSLPTVVIENDDGVVDRFIGVTQREDIETAIQQAL